MERLAKEENYECIKILLVQEKFCSSFSYKATLPPNRRRAGKSRTTLFSLKDE